MFSRPSFIRAANAPANGTIPSTVQDLETFGGGQRRRGVRVYRPRSEEEVAGLVSRLAADGSTFAPFGAGLSFDSQGLNDRVVISTAGLRSLHVDHHGKRLRAGAGVTTGEAQSAALEVGLTLPVLPSSSRITLGGSASCDSYSRMTPGLGRESRYIRSFRIVTGRGETFRCSRNENRDLFFAAIGGFGLAGIITEVEHQLTAVGAHAAFRSSAHAFLGVTGFEYLIPEHRPPGLPAGPWPGAGSIVLAPGGRVRTMVTRHRYEDTRHRARSVVHQRGTARLLLDLLVRELPSLAGWLWRVNWVPHRPVQLVDDFSPATFFMDGHLDGAAISRRLGRPTSVLQQSYVIPIANRDKSSVRPVERFVEEAQRRIGEAGMSAGMFDVGFLPAGEPFVLSANRSSDAFLVSLAFMAKGNSQPAAIHRLFEELTDRCAKDYGGTVHLTKQAHCSDDVLRALYAEPIERLRQLRATHDPAGRIDTYLGRRLGLSSPASLETLLHGRA
ncbi:MAG: FAD-binding oxidoreductase [Myxococcota bacterium]